MSLKLAKTTALAMLTATLAAMVLGSCSQYDKLLKSNDNELKYKEAKKYYEDRRYMKAYTLLENVANYYKGTEESDEVLFLIAESYRHNSDYIIANNYYNTYVKSFPTGNHVEECWFLAGKSLYELSPDARLDQTETVNALSALEEYTQLFSNGQFIEEANKLISEMRDKLATKAYLSAKLYYNLGNYLGNNYLSAVVTAQNALKDYPETKLREDLSFLILKAKYEQAKKTVQSKKTQRYIETVDEYYNFKSEYPNGKYIKEANKIYDNSKEYAKADE